MPVGKILVGLNPNMDAREYDDPNNEALKYGMLSDIFTKTYHRKTMPVERVQFEERSMVA